MPAALARPTFRLDPIRRTPGQRWRRKRDLVIAAAHRAGFSERWLADVFDLARSRVAEIVLSARAESERRPRHEKC